MKDALINIAIGVIVAVVIVTIIGFGASEWALIRWARKWRRETNSAPVSREDADVLAAYERDFKRGHYAREPRRARRRS